MAKKRSVGRYPNAFRKMAVERLKSCDNIVALSEELGVHRRLLYKWRDQLEPIEDGQGPPADSQERELRQQVSRLKRLVADKTLEVDFFKGALQKVEARRQSRGNVVLKWCLVALFQKASKNAPPKTHNKRPELINPAVSKPMRCDTVECGESDNHQLGTHLDALLQHSQWKVDVIVDLHLRNEIEADLLSAKTTAESPRFGRFRSCTSV